MSEKITTVTNFKLISYTPDGVVTAQIADGPLLLQQHATQLIQEPTVFYGFNSEDKKLIEQLAKDEK